MLKTLFVVSGNKNAGSGHIKRCILLSSQFKKKDFFFIGIKKQKYYKIDNNLNFEIKKFDKRSVTKIKEICKKLRINRIIIDHTNINFKVQKALYDKYFLTVFDNQKKINFIADVIINANPNAKIKDYSNRIKNKNTQFFLGNNFSLIKLPLTKIKNNIPDSIFFCFGGGDDKKFILKFLKYVKKNNFNGFFKIKLVVGPLNENFKKYRAYINNNDLKNIKLYFNPKNIYGIMQKCFFAIVSPGTLFYELSYFNKPVYLIYLNKKQKNLASSWNKNNLIQGFQNFRSNDFKKIIENMYFFKHTVNKFKVKKFKYGNNSKKIILNLDKLYSRWYEQSRRSHSS